jgi:small subunit ribosomal protein S1
MPDTSEQTLNPATETPPRALGFPAVPLNYDEEEELTPERRAEIFGHYEESLRSLGEGEIVRGTVLAVDDKEVLVDVGFKSEGVIALSEFPDPASIQVGQVIDVFLEKMENQDGLVVLSKQRADFVRVWDKVKEAHDRGEVVEGRLVRKIKGGVVVDLYGVEAFLPGSQIALRQVQNVDGLLGQTVQVKIIKLNKRRRNIVVSRRAVLEQERDRMKSTILKDLAKDQIREGVVKNITDFGAFIDLGGVQGLVPISEISHVRVARPGDRLQVGEAVTVKVLRVGRTGAGCRSASRPSRATRGRA